MQAVRLKGMATAEAVAAATGGDEAGAAAALQALVALGDVQERNGRFRVTREGRDRLDEELARERAGLDSNALGAVYSEFQPLNAEFKDLASRWQTRDGEPNDHADANHDAAIITDLERLDERFTPLLARIVELAPPRIGAYPPRFVSALERVRAGEHDWLLKPIIDSYHTVWFELHEELYGLLGRSRVQEESEEAQAA
jgi:pyruvate,orthophosphate dikinase